jgi:hypothetical protein
MAFAMFLRVAAGTVPREEESFIVARPRELANSAVVVDPMASTEGMQGGRQPMTGTANINKILAKRPG